MSYNNRLNKVARPIIALLIILMMALLLFFNQIESQLKVVRQNYQALVVSIPEYCNEWQAFLESHSTLPKPQVDALSKVLKELGEMDMTHLLENQEVADKFSETFESYQKKMNALWENLNKDTKHFSTEADKQQAMDWLIKQKNFNLRVRLFASVLVTYNGNLQQTKYNYINNLFFVREPVSELTLHTFPIEPSSIDWLKNLENNSQQQ